METPYDLVLKYFRGVDDENIKMIFETMTEDCAFSVETHGVKLQGRDEIHGIFDRLWANHEWVRHDQFHFVESNHDIAVRFQVTNKTPDGGLVYKSNCNFFTIRDGLFSEIRVYMTGENTLIGNPDKG